MSFLAQRLIGAVRCQPSLISNLTINFRALSVTKRLLQQNHDLTLAQPLPILNKAVSPVAEQKQCQQVFDQVNAQLSTGAEGRLFAVVHLCGKQFKITAGDIILVEGYWPPTSGDEICLEKVLLAGANDFTLIGRPILDAGLVNIRATVIEKTLTHTKTHFKKKRRKQYLRVNFQRAPNTMIRINSIEIGRPVDAASPIPANDKRVF